MFDVDGDVALDRVDVGAQHGLAIGGCTRAMRAPTVTVVPAGTPKIRQHSGVHSILVVHAKPRRPAPDTRDCLRLLEAPVTFSRSVLGVPPLRDVAEVGNDARHVRIGEHVPARRLEPANGAVTVERSELEDDLSGTIQEAVALARRARAILRKDIDREVFAGHLFSRPTQQPLDRRTHVEHRSIDARDRDDIGALFRQSTEARFVAPKRGFCLDSLRDVAQHRQVKPRHDVGHRAVVEDAARSIAALKGEMSPHSPLLLESVVERLRVVARRGELDERSPEELLASQGEHLARGAVGVDVLTAAVGQQHSVERTLEDGSQNRLAAPQVLLGRL